MLIIKETIMAKCQSVYYHRCFGCITLLQYEKITVEIRNNGNYVKRNCECVKSSARTVLVQTNLKLMLRPFGWTVPG